MPRPRIARLFDHTARHWRPVKSLGAIRIETTTFEDVGSFACAINRPSARLGDPGPGLTNVGERIVYAETSVDLRPRDVLEITAGPETGRRIEIDEEPTNVRGHHLEARARIFAGEIEPTTPDPGES